MSTPHKKQQHFESPYARPPMQMQYPSQSEDYISFDMGGANKCSSTPAKQENANKVPPFYQNKPNQFHQRNQGQQRFNQNFGRNSYGGGGGGHGGGGGGYRNQQRRPFQNQRGSWSVQKSVSFFVALAKMCILICFSQK